MTPDTTQAHLSSAAIGALIDAELSAPELDAAQQHLSTCHACALAVIAAMQLKSATARAGQRFIASPEALVRLTVQLQPQTAGVFQHEPAPHRQPARVLSFRTAGWIALAASIVLFAILFGWQRHREADTLTAELLDQHLASLSDGAAPEVISTDRHTVKPWFQGKLPFSFNLPEPTALPAETTLQGADLAFLDGQPAAQLLFTIHKHHVSVFLTQRSAAPTLVSPQSARNGFSLHEATTQDLRLTAVSDVNPTDLDALLQALVRVQ